MAVAAAVVGRTSTHMAIAVGGNGSIVEHIHKSAKKESFLFFSVDGFGS